MRSRLVATRDWIVSNYPPGTAGWLSHDGAELNQPPMAESYVSLTTLHVVGGGFYVRRGALKVGESYLVALRKGMADGGAYRVEDVPRWTIFWGEEMDRLVGVLRSLTQCAQERTGLPMRTDAQEFERVRPTLATWFRDRRRPAIRMSADPAHRTRVTGAVAQVPIGIFRSEPRPRICRHCSPRVVGRRIRRDRVTCPPRWVLEPWSQSTAVL